MRSGAWLGLAIVAYVMTGLVSLFVTSYLFASALPATEARELVLASQTVLWGLLAGAAVIGTGYLAIGAVSPRISALSVVAVLVAVVASYVVTADARGGAVLDLDRVGVAIWVSPVALALGLALFGAESGGEHAGAIWRIVAVVCALALVAVGAISLFAVGGRAITTAVVLAASIGTGVITSVVAARRRSFGGSRWTTSTSGRGE